MNYKASIVISGAMTESVYSPRLKTVIRAAARKLSEYEPGFGNTWPQHFQVFQSLGEVSGNRSNWKPLFQVPYRVLRQDWHNWRIRKAKRHENATKER